LECRLCVNGGGYLFLKTGEKKMSEKNNTDIKNMIEEEYSDDK
jgi:hypothetical protein